MQLRFSIHAIIALTSVVAVLFAGVMLLLRNLADVYAEAVVGCTLAVPLSPPIIGVSAILFAIFGVQANKSEALCIGLVSALTIGVGISILSFVLMCYIGITYY